MIHDQLVAAFWSFDEPIQPNEYRSRALIESAVNRPFQYAFGRPAYPTTTAKAAAMFHSLVTNHPFENGNKRTAVIAVDLFLLANGRFLFLTQSEIYRLARETASHNERNIAAAEMYRQIAKMFRKMSVCIHALDDKEFAGRMNKHRLNIRKGIFEFLFAPEKQRFAERESAVSQSVHGAAPKWAITVVEMTDCWRAYSAIK